VTTTRWAASCARARSGIPDSATWADYLEHRLGAATLAAFQEWADAGAQRAVLKRAAAIDLVYHQRAGRLHYDA
jgi:hypothetical protein